MDNNSQPVNNNNKNNRLEGVVSLPQPPVFVYLTALILTIVFISLVFLSLGSYARKERVTGILQPDTGLLRLSAPQPGILTQLLVKEGQPIEKDQALLRIKSEKQGIAGFELNQSLISQYRYQVTMLKQRLEQQKLHHQIQLKDLNEQRISLQLREHQVDFQKDIYQQRITLNKDIVLQLMGLAGSGYISALELQKQKDNLLSLHQQNSTNRLERLVINSQIDKISHQLVQLPIEHQQDISQLTQQLAEAKLQMSTIAQQRLTEIRASGSGTVSGLLVKQGGSVTAAQHLLSILPAQSQLQAIIYVPPSAIGFVEKGQGIRLRYHAFPYAKFGVFDGELLEVSANVILPGETGMPGLISQPSYRVVVQLAGQHISAYGRKIPLRSGMKLDADIIIEQRSLLRWLFDPVFSIQAAL